MGGLSKAKSGSYRKQLICWDGVRREVQLGKNKKNAQTVANYIDRMNQSLKFNLTFEADIQSWLANCSDTIKNKLKKLNLLPDSQDIPTTVGGFTEFYIDDKNPKAATRRKLKNARDKLVDKFGADRLMSRVNKGDAASFYNHLKKKGFSEAHINRTIGHAKQFFLAAVDYEIITKDPFKKLSASVSANANRKFYVTPELSSCILEACPNLEWRLRFVFMRWLGLRCPSEMNSLKWEDVEWGGSKIAIHDSKRQHHGFEKSLRYPAILPEVRLYLEEAFEQAEEGSVRILRNTSHKNYRKAFLKILKNAGVTPWPNLFNNLRKSAVTDAAAWHPSHVVNEWFGHSEIISNEFYRQVTEEDYRLATERGPAIPQKLPQQASVKREEERREEKNSFEVPLKSQQKAQQAVARRTVRKNKMGDEGLEPPTLSV